MSMRDELVLESLIRDMKKYILRVIIGVFMLFSACFGGLMMWVAADTADSVEPAERFLDHLSLREYHDAYALTAALFRAEQTEERFVEVVETVLFSDYELQHWRNRTLERGDVVRFRGTIVDDFGINVPIALDVAREAGEWKVLSMTGPVRRGLGPGAWFRSIPTKPEIQRMVKADLMAFIQGVDDKDLTAFYDNNMAASFQIRIHVTTFQRAYQHFIDKEIDISALEDVDAVLDGVREFEPDPELVELLVVEGYYPIEPLPVHFVFRYWWQHPEWKLDGILVDEPDPGLLTPSQCMMWLVAEDAEDISRCFEE